ncbi:P1 family peptidase [Gammaproteobacteria bacterium]|nr:P1 family peptidase [Gammaproteobacteria bacterium]MDB4164735.1 P1 family peptidase [Gammaproteobacteria bacterium]MDB9758967.1 P1 family peptidase [Gammaproteobacteria bacterium]MDB9981446.1 P1 family peptidase [Gammaproteobacteria bacterium]MDC0934421.1 P1 family peptidase [Gammaproteobacteria bacterium]
MRDRLLCLLAAAIASASVVAQSDVQRSEESRPRARDIGLIVGIFEPGEMNAITDVGNVKVGHTTVFRGDDIRTGVTAIIPAEGNLYTHPIPAWIHVGNGYGKLIGETQVREFGEIETPILLTCTLCVWSAANALKEWVYTQPGMGEHTVNPIVGETNDARVNNMWADPIQREEVFDALANASGGAVEEGSVGAGTGTQAFGWKGGIGTSSRVLPKTLGGYTVGVLVQTNYGGIMSINGAPVGRELGTYAFKNALPPDNADREDGSIMVVVATDAPLSELGLSRLSMRAMLGLGRTGSYASNGSGDYVIAFSTNPTVRKPRVSSEPVSTTVLVNDSLSPLFAATAEATVEAVYNAILKATTVSSARGELKAVPVDAVKEILEKYNALNWDESF